MWKFENIETHLGDKIRARAAVLKEIGLHQEWEELDKHAYFELIEEWKSGKELDELIAYSLDQFDNGPYGYPFFLAISKGLRERGDRPRFDYMWQSLLAKRKLLYKSDVVATGEVYIGELEKLGDTRAIELVRQEIAEHLLIPSEPIDPPNIPQINKIPSTDSRLMTESLFWKLIANARDESSTPFHRVLNLKEALLKFRPSQISKFAKILHDKLVQLYRWDLWGIAYIVFGGCGDDAFESFRAWIISEGPEVFERLSEDPECLVDMNLDPNQLDGFASIADVAYEQKTDQELLLDLVFPESPSGEEWEETEEVLQSKFPRAYNHSW